MGGGGGGILLTFVDFCLKSVGDGVERDGCNARRGATLDGVQPPPPFDFLLRPRCLRERLDRSLRCILTLNNVLIFLTPSVHSPLHSLPSIPSPPLPSLLLSKSDAWLAHKNHLAVRSITNLSLLPPSGCLVVVSAPKIAVGVMPVRVVAMCHIKGEGGGR